MDLLQRYEHSYVPYSHQPELALVRGQEGEYFPGIRIENISYPLSITAAQNALFCCISEGKKPDRLLTTNPEDPFLPLWKKEFNISVEKLDTENPPDIVLAEIILHDHDTPDQLLINLLERARVPNSNFPVAALAETNQGYIGGANIECTSWNMGLCAERVAIAKALTYDLNIKALHIHSRDGDYSSPCGACRQVIIEHIPEKKIYLHHSDHTRSNHFAKDLLPFSFHSNALSNL
ncbi:cytidine deaminase [Aliifodinibius salicampi]|uniref:Cytidine deaminase n=1 Tax=Fodinibius salicampi TaxID=1920655 RepID=A0ABT3PUJ1_9BACT|nr:cytidine deaminase [Fodinibius salicampi]MCW9711512.1 cytidine deaminase [Fodinibius salicampi]